MSAALKIKQVADASGFTAATLRYYEQIGLLPEATRTPTGYRLYDERTIERLAFIARAKQLGCTLDEIVGLSTAWDGGECGPVQDRLRELVVAKIEAAEHRIHELSTFRDDLRRAAAAFEGHRPAGACDADCGCVAAPVADGATPQRRAPLPTKIALTSRPARTDEPALACSLSTGSIQRRMEEWRSVLGHAVLREPTPDGLRAVFAASAPLAELMRLVTAEQDCCPFLRFAITVDTRGVALEVGAPDDAMAIVESLFEVAP